MDATPNLHLKAEAWPTITERSRVPLIRMRIGHDYTFAMSHAEAIDLAHQLADAVARGKSGASETRMAYPTRPQRDRAALNEPPR
jgi:hypothetical protein